MAMRRWSVAAAEDAEDDVMDVTNCSRELEESAAVVAANDFGGHAIAVGVEPAVAVVAAPCFASSDTNLSRPEQLALNAHVHPAPRVSLQCHLAAVAAVAPESHSVVLPSYSSSYSWALETTKMMNWLAAHLFSRPHRGEKS